MLEEKNPSITIASTTKKFSGRGLINWLKRRWILLALSLTVGGLVAITFTRLGQKTSSAPQQSLKQPLKVTKIYPQVKKFSAANATTPLYVTFDNSIEINTIQITSDPSIKFNLQIRPNNPSQLVLQPTSPWQENVNYQITIGRGATSTDGQYVLGEDVVLKFTVEGLEFPQYDRPI